MESKRFHLVAHLVSPAIAEKPVPPKHPRHPVGLLPTAGMATTCLGGWTNPKNEAENYPSSHDHLVKLARNLTRPISPKRDTV